MNDPILDYWNDRAKLGIQAGSGDMLAKQLEIDAICSQLMPGARIAEFGCGNAITAMEIARRFDVTIQCYDFSEKMLEEAEKLAAREELGSRLSFAVADIRNPPEILDRYDFIITERMLINLPDWDTQAQAIAFLTGLLANGGHYLMCENSATGLAALNQLRAAVKLPAIEAPWHNRYLDDAEVAALRIRHVRLAKLLPFSATYYFLSRVVNASLAAQESRAPNYDAPINQLALHLPPFGDCAQGKLWVWRRDEQGETAP